MFYSHGNLYHLVREGIVTGDDGVPEAMLCSTCYGLVKTNHVPKFCIASGYDYCRIAGLPELSLLEKIVISPYRLYTTILKLKPAAGSNSQAAQSCLTWHAILFEHHAVRAVLEAILRHSFSDMSRDIAVAFLGSRE